MISRFFRAFFWGILFASVLTWLYLGSVTASAREAILVEDRYSEPDLDLIRPTEYRFLPARAFPRRVRLHPVEVDSRFYRYIYRRGLPQSKALGLKDAFFINVRFQLRFSLNQDKLVSLFERLDRPSWTLLEPYIARRLDYFLNRKVLEFYPNDRALPALKGRLENYLETAAAAEMRAFLEPEGVKLESVIVEKVFIPDPVQYQAIVARSGEFIARELERIKQIDEARTREYAARILDRAYFSRLEGIGRLLRKYPQLREYLAIDRLGKNVDVVVMPYDRYFGGGKPKAGPEVPGQPPVLERILRKRDDRGRRDVKNRRGDGRANRNYSPGYRGNGRVNGNGNDFRNGGNGGFKDLTPP